MKPEVKKMWLEALRSSNYEQGKGTLRQIGRDGNPDRFCCLGVLCDIAVKEGLGVDVRVDEDAGLARYGESQSVLPYDVRKWAGLETSNPGVTLIDKFHAYFDATEEAIALVNDAGASFEEIADMIEASL